METNLLYCTRTGRTISEKTMEDGNDANINDKISSATIANLYTERPTKLTTNGHNSTGEPSSPSEPYEPRRQTADNVQDDRSRQRINPLRIHLGKRPFVENSISYSNASKRRKPYVIKHSDTSISKTSVPRVPKLIPKRADQVQFNNAKIQLDSTLDNERNKPVPRLVPKSHLSQFKKSKVEKGPQLKEYAQSLGLQPMVKFKCRKCCSMSFKTLGMLKEHQLVCRAQAKEPAISPEAAVCTDMKQNTGGPSRVTRKVYLCSACGTYYENWNLFLHMREIHNRHICLFCLGMFSKAEKLSAHLTNKHNVQEFNFDSKDEFTNVHNGTFYLMCCACDEIYCEKDDYFNHDCNNVKPKPVPVLVSKNSMKPNSVKNVKQDSATNGPSVVKSLIQPLCDKKDIGEQKIENISTPSQSIINNKNNFDYLNSDTSISSMNSSESMNRTNDSVDSAFEQENHIGKSESPKHHISQVPPNLSNGDDHLDESEESDTPDMSIVQEPPVLHATKPNVDLPCPPTEKEGGIKLKLSLNNANSPVIINSTVDPTVGQNYANKPPSRIRRPPKRYEKDNPPDSSTPVKPPSIKMTICDRADSPFVKTTIYENNKETIVKTLINNNVESALVNPNDNKSDTTIKSTIYDNKFEDENTLNRVPKLTVRVPKEFLDKDSSSDYSSDSDVSDKLTVDDRNEAVNQKIQEREDSITEATSSTPQVFSDATADDKVNLESQIREEEHPPIEAVAPSVELKSEPQDIDVIGEGDITVDEPNPIEDIPVTELTLDRPLDKYPLKDLLKVFLSSTIFNCIYCNHGRVIAVNCGQLALHMVSEHRFAATVDSITAEELMPETITAKLKSGAEELNSVFINLDTYDSVDKCDKMTFNQLFECFQCYFKTTVHKDLYLHNRKMHQKTILLCVMCKNNFYTYSELICHLCPGTYDSDCEIRYRCCFCTVDTISSSFRLMVHLRKIHHTCDVCLEFCQSQARLSNHVWKHKLHHLCYRCGIAYRNKPDINNHLFWKHGTESVLCKKCLHKKWPHVYHFCIPPAVFVCDECALQFTRAVYLKVHKRFHSEEFPHVCSQDGCLEKFVSKKLLNKHLEEHRKSLFTESLNEEKISETVNESQKEQIPVIDLDDTKTKVEVESAVVKVEAGTENASKKIKKKKIKDKDALLLDVDLPALNLSESDSSDESDSGQPSLVKNNLQTQDNVDNETLETKCDISNTEVKSTTNDLDDKLLKDEKIELTEDKPSEDKVLEIWDNFKKYQAKVEKQREKTPPLVPIRKHVCDSDHDYCVIPTEFNVDEECPGSDKKKSKKSKKVHGDLSSSSSSSSDSDSSCSCGSNCSCSSSSGSSSSSSSDSDSSDESDNEKKKKKQLKKTSLNRRLSNGSNVDVMGMSETPVLVPEKTEPLIAETDLETDESETDEEFYDKNPQQTANKVYSEKRNQLLLATTTSEGGSVSGDLSHCTTPVKEEEVEKKLETEMQTELKIEEVKPDEDTKNKTSSSKKKSKKKKKSKGSRKHGPIKINIPKDIIRTEPETKTPSLPLIPNKITISLQTKTVQIPEVPKASLPLPTVAQVSTATAEKKRSSKRRRVPNKFYGYSSDEESSQNTILTALKPQQPPKLEWRKEDLPSPVTHKVKKEIPTLVPQKLFNYNEPIRFAAPPAPDPEPPRILMNSESMESSDSESSEEGALQIHQPSAVQNSIPVPPPTYLNSGTSSLPYPFQSRAVRQAREGESVYCYCRCPYDEVSEMIACDAEGCNIEWFHFECVGIMVPPKGKWYCPECRKNQSFSGYR